MNDCEQAEGEHHCANHTTQFQENGAAKADADTS